MKRTLIFLLCLCLSAAAFCACSRKTDDFTVPTALIMSYFDDDDSLAEYKAEGKITEYTDKENGYVTLSLTDPQRRMLLAEVKDDILEEMGEMSQGEERIPYIKDIRPTSDLSSYSVQIAAQDSVSVKRADFSELLDYSALYGILNGKPADRVDVTVTITDTDTLTTISTITYRNDK